MRRNGFPTLLLGLLLAACAGTPLPPGPNSPSKQGPPDPGGFVAVAASPTSVNLSWTASEGATGYALERKTGSGSFAPIAANLTQTSHTDSGLSPSTTYTYRLKALNTHGSSTGLERSLTTPAAEAPPQPNSPPPTPSQISATAASPTSVNLTWAAVAGASRYVLERRTGSGAYSAIGGSNLTATSFTDTGLSPSTTYTYRVAAANAQGSSAPRESASVTTPAAPAPNPPTPPSPPPPSTPPFDVQGRTLTYSPSSEDFLNPERGIHIGFQLLEGNDYRGIRAGSTYPNQPGDTPYPATVLLTYLRLAEYRNAPLPESFLLQIRNRLNHVRESGIKVIIRPYYAFPGVTGNEDAPLARVLEHIRQLGPVFNEHQDVIIAIQQGFIGYWGEGHSSTNGLESEPNRRTITQAMLEAFPPSRTVMIRRIRDIAPLMFAGPLPAGQEFSGNPQSRLSFFNDCFLANFHDAGAYRWNADELAADQRYLERLGQYAPVVGETCEVGWTGGETEFSNPRSNIQRSDCTTTLRELARFRWSILSGTQYRPVIARWKRDGCYAEISRRLGYRFRLVAAVIPDSVAAGANLRMAFDVFNEGFAAPFNPRGAQLILRHRTSRQVAVLPLNTDPRRWAPGQTTRVFVDLPLPSTVGAGEYELLLNLPDGSSRLAADPRYSIRLANADLWEASTGYNALQASIRVQ